MTSAPSSALISTSPCKPVCSRSGLGMRRPRELPMRTMRVSWPNLPSGYNVVTWQAPGNSNRAEGRSCVPIDWDKLPRLSLGSCPVTLLGRTIPYMVPGTRQTGHRPSPPSSRQTPCQPRMSALSEGSNIIMKLSTGHLISRAAELGMARSPSITTNDGPITLIPLSGALMPAPITIMPPRATR